MLSFIGRQSNLALAGFGRFGLFLSDTARAVPDARTWGSVLVVQMRRIGVDSLPISLFIAAFTGIVLALLASYTFTGAVPLYRLALARSVIAHVCEFPGSSVTNPEPAIGAFTAFVMWLTGSTQNQSAFSGV